MKKILFLIFLLAFFVVGLIFGSTAKAQFNLSPSQLQQFSGFTSPTSSTTVKSLWSNSGVPTEEQCDANCQAALSTATQLSGCDALNPANLPYAQASRAFQYCVDIIPDGVMVYLNLDGSITITCANKVIRHFPPTQGPGCNVPCGDNSFCQAATDGCVACVGGTCQQPPPPAPGCNTPCSGNPSICSQASGGCTVCDNASGTCQAPPPGPGCNTPCSGNPAICSQASGGCTVCGSNGTCQTPPACGVACTTPADCQNAKDGCTTCTGGVCKPPAACGVACTTPADCAAAKDGCTDCSGGVCKPPAACGVACSTPADCQNAKDGCTTCTGGVCKPPAACGVACTTPADCAAAKDGCTDCSGGVCKPPAACGIACSTPADCQNAKDGCTACVTGVCRTPPACNVPCSNDFQCAGAKDGCSMCLGGVCKTPPACGTACTVPGDCAASKDGCTTCIGNKCVAPPACGVACDSKVPQACAGAKDSCTTCSNNICTAPACGIACSTPADCAAAKDGCTSCDQNKCQTPFSTDFCHCDGIQYSNLATGQEATITAFAKVEGADQVSRAQVVSQKFTLYQFQGDSVIGTAILSANVPATVVSSSPTLVRYQSVWKFTVPNLQPGLTYRIGVVANDAGTCTEKSIAYNYSPTQKRVVLGSSTQPQSVWGAFWNFILGLFGGGTPSPSQAPSPAVVNVQQSNVSPTNYKDLKLGTFHPIEVIQKTCNFLIFKVS